MGVSGPPWFGPVELLVLRFAAARLRGAGPDGTRDEVHAPEQIVAKLREHEKLPAQGLTSPQACKKIGISDQTFYRWRTRYGALKEDEAHRLKALETENARLKKIVADDARSPILRRV
jgi:hypothetical protein